MMRIASGAAIVALLSAGGSAAATPSVSADPAQENAYALLGAICDTLGPDTFVFADSPLAANETTAPEVPVTVGWIDVLQSDRVTGEYLSHGRILEEEDVSVDEICSFEIDGAGVGLTVTMGFDLGTTGS